VDINVMDYVERNVLMPAENAIQIWNAL
jgi:hypothetical protein